MRIGAGLILAGGRSTRMLGADKAFCRLGGRTLVDWALAGLSAQVRPIAISSNADPVRFASLALPVLADGVGDFQGPLAGLLAGLDWAAALPDRPSHLVSVAVDSPFFPDDLVVRLDEALDGAAAIAVAVTDRGRQPVFAAWPLALADDLRAFLAAGDVRRVGAFLARHTVRPVVFAVPAGAAGDDDPFFNINGPEDLAAAEVVAGRFSPSRFGSTAAVAP